MELNQLSPRGAKGWLGRAMEGGYSATRDQAALTTLLEVQMVRDRQVRSFRRLESAMLGIVSAAIGGTNLISPC